MHLPAGGEQLKILIEKDFHCIETRTDEEEWGPLFEPLRLQTRGGYHSILVILREPPQPSIRYYCLTPAQALVIRIDDESAPSKKSD
jgi:hypothetical protein